MRRDLLARERLGEIGNVGRQTNPGRSARGR